MTNEKTAQIGETTAFNVKLKPVKEGFMDHKLTKEELNSLDHNALVLLILSMQDQIALLTQSVDNLTEQIRLANSHRFGRKTEKLSQIEGQLSFFDEAEEGYDPDAAEPDVEEVIPSKPRRKRSKGKLDADLKNIPSETFRHPISDSEADAYYGKGCWRRLKPEVYKKLQYTPASWLAEIHEVDVIVGKSGDHQDEFIRGKRPKELLKHSLLTTTLASAILNGKFGKSIPFARIESEFKNFDVNISKQTMCNWTMALSERYFMPFYNLLRNKLLSMGVTQADETPVLVLQDGRPTPTKSWMWVHRSSELYAGNQIVLYEYQKTRHHDFPKKFYKDYKGILVTDGLQQYHMLEKLIPGFTSANCWVHGRRHFADALKAAPKGSDPEELKRSVAYQALKRISAIYEIEGTLKNLSAEERLNRRQADIKPLVEEFFAWIRSKQASMSVLPKSETGKGINYFLNQEKYLKVFLSDGNVPIDNSASERSIRPFTIGRKNWLFNNTIRGAQASAVIYSVVETAKANNLRPYQYLNHLLTELVELTDENGNIDQSGMEKLLPWAKEIPKDCRKN